MRGSQTCLTKSANDFSWIEGLPRLSRMARTNESLGREKTWEARS